MATWWSRPCRNRLLLGNATTLMPAAATFSATRCCTASVCMPRLTQWLAVTRWGKPLASTRSARSSRAKRVGSRVSSVCRSIGRPASAATVRNRSLAAAGSSSRWGQPPMPSMPIATASRRAPAGCAPAGPWWATGEREHLDAYDRLQGLAHREQRADRGEAVGLGEVGMGSDGGGAVGGDQPCRALGTTLRCPHWVMRSRWASIARMAPIRSPVGFGTVSARNALSRWAWASARAGSSKRTCGGQQHVSPGWACRRARTTTPVDDAHRGGAVGEQGVGDGERRSTQPGGGGVVRHRPPSPPWREGRLPRPRTRCRRA